MGGKSSSTTSTTTKQTTEAKSQESSGVVAGDVLQIEGGDLVQEFGDNVANAFSQLIDLTNKTIDVAADTGQTALTQVAARAQAQETPSIASLESFKPLLTTAIIVGGIVIVALKWKGK